MTSEDCAVLACMEALGMTQLQLKQFSLILVDITLQCLLRAKTVFIGENCPVKDSIVATCVLSGRVRCSLSVWVCRLMCNVHVVCVLCACHQLLKGQVYTMHGLQYLRMM